MYGDGRNLQSIRRCVASIKKEIDEINQQLTIRTDYESDAYMKLIERVSELSEKYYSIEEVNYEAEVEKVLKGLGFEREDFTRSTSGFREAGECVSNWRKFF